MTSTVWPSHRALRAARAGRAWWCAVSLSHEGVVYEKDLGPKTLEIFRSMTLFDPDETWSPVPGS